MEILNRLNAPTPKFWKKVRNVMITVGAIGGVIMTAPVSLPVGLVSLGTYAVVIGAVGATFSQTRK